ncbi:hypothetical protein NC652_018611 [Populus alba x Populus x berolinensis]|nr:hypothetical protein NC652_018611 [Populus alba x Populus x berolinensis]
MESNLLGRQMRFVSISARSILSQAEHIPRVTTRYFFTFHFQARNSLNFGENQRQVEASSHKICTVEYMLLTSGDTRSASLIVWNPAFSTDKGYRLQDSFIPSASSMMTINP